MALDPKAREVTIPYSGGFISLTRGLAEAVFGTNLNKIVAQGSTTTVNVKAHQRVRVIGQPATNVSAYSYTYKKWPTGVAENAKGGQPVMFNLSTGGDWTVRVHGPLSELASWLYGKVNDTGMTFTSQRGTVYGPFSILQN